MILPVMTLSTLEEEPGAIGGAKSGRTNERGLRRVSNFELSRRSAEKSSERRRAHGRR
jgi:hypothetical protein